MAPPSIPPERGIYCNRTLNLRSVRAIGYDMDYTLIHYFVEEWERAAFDHARELFAVRAWPVDDLEFDPQAFTVGLTFDLELGNLVKATRFGYVVRAQHGAEGLSFDEQRRAYSGTVVDLGESRFEFMNTMFELSRANLWAQLIAIHDARPLPGIRSYAELYRVINDVLNESHMPGAIKADIIADPGRFVDLDPGIATTLEDQRTAGKQLLLITNSDWSYTRTMMEYAVGRYCSDGTSWRDLFDIVIVSAAKPRFFSHADPIYRVVDEDRSLLLPHHGPLEPGNVYFGGNAGLVEASLDHDSAQMLYVGDHLFGDVHVSKALRWRTALIARELEGEITSARAFAESEEVLTALMIEKVSVDRHQAHLRMERKRSRADARAISAELDEVTGRAVALDDEIAPLARAASELGNPVWGQLMRAGNDKSLFARQVEKYADVYTSRVSNFALESPYGYLRAARGSLPHDG